jgi:hypothetical protein
MDEKRYLGLLDMLNGGGPGQAGPEFMGGPLSGLLNALGIRPMGAGRAMEESPSQMQRPMPMPAQMPAPALTPPVMPAVEAQQLPPFGQMSNEDLMRMILQALQSAPSGYGVGPR